MIAFSTRNSQKVPFELSEDIILYPEYLCGFVGEMESELLFFFLKDEKNVLYTRDKTLRYILSHKRLE